MKIVSRPLQHVCFAVITASIREGDAYIFVAIDVESEFVFQLGVERDRSEQVFIQQVKNLLLHEEFARHIGNDFILVFDGQPPVPDLVNALLKPLGGSFIIDKELHHHTLRPFLEFLQKQ